MLHLCETKSITALEPGRCSHHFKNFYHISGMRSFLVTIIFSGFNLAIHTGHKSINNIYLFICTETDTKDFYPATEQKRGRKSGRAQQKQFDFIRSRANKSSIYSTKLNRGWNLLIETLLRSFSFMWVRKEETKPYFFPLLARMSHHNFRINQNQFYVHTSD